MDRNPVFYTLIEFICTRVTMPLLNADRLLRVIHVYVSKEGQDGYSLVGT